jgi:putative addiction module component (TIGR02574 family)
MSERAEKLKPLLDALSADERDEIIDYLVGRADTGTEEDMTQEEWEAAWVEEINRRLEDLRSGRTQGVPAEEVMRRMREKYG